jgi:hypothetical protein
MAVPYQPEAASLPDYMRMLMGSMNRMMLMAIKKMINRA